jgi:CRP-like cAMP-binding protein
MFAPADIVIEEGEKSSVLYFIIQGTVDIYHPRTNSSFKEITKGKYFGEIGFFTNKPRTASVRCLDFVDILALSHDKVDFILEKFPEAKESMKLFAERCKEEDYSVLRVRCFLCKRLGHVATKCKQVLINLDQEEVREKWLKSKLNASKKIAEIQSEDDSVQRSKLVKRRLRHKAINVVGMERSIMEMYSHNPELVNKTLLWMKGQPLRIQISRMNADDEIKSPELIMKSGMSYVISEESESELSESDEGEYYEPQLEFNRSLIESPKKVQDKIDEYLNRQFTRYTDSPVNLLQMKAVESRQSQDFID